MRGRTLNHAFIILDEAQNTTPEQMLMFLTRLGFDSKCVVTGDLTQIDLPAARRSGLLEAKENLQRIPGMGFDSKCVVTGDLTQVDLPSSKTSGLLEARDSLSAVSDIAFVELQDADVVRHALVMKIIRAYRDHRARTENVNGS